MNPSKLGSTSIWMSDKTFLQLKMLHPDKPNQTLCAKVCGHIGLRMNPEWLDIAFLMNIETLKLEALTQAKHSQPQ